MCVCNIIIQVGFYTNDVIAMHLRMIMHNCNTVYRYSFLEYNVIIQRRLSYDVNCEIN